MNWNRIIFRSPAVHALTALACALLGYSPAVAAVDFPTRPLELSIVFSPGGALDVAARALAQEAQAILGQNIVAQNNPGGGGLPGMAKLATSPADGYHLAACVSNALVFIPHRNHAPYRPLRDVEPIISFGQASPLLVVKPDGPWATLDDFFAATRAHKGELRIGVPGLGSPSHIALVMMSKKDPTLSWRFVPFAGPGEAEAALLGGHVDAAASGALPRIKSGQLRPLLVLSGQRLPSLADIPSLTDKHFADPGQGDSTFVLLAPAGTPPEVLAVLEAAFLQAAQSEAFLSALNEFSVSPLVRNREEAIAFLRGAWQNESDILRAIGLTEPPATEPE